MQRRTDQNPSGARTERRVQSGKDPAAVRSEKPSPLLDPKLTDVSASLQSVDRYGLRHPDKSYTWHMFDRTEVWSQMQKSPVVFSVVYDSFDRDMDVSRLLRILSRSEMRAFRAVLDPDRAFQFLWGRALFVYVTRSFLGI